MIKNNDQRGVIAIFLSVILGLLLLTTTTFAARVSVNELNQASAVDRSEQAYYAAEAGIEEAIRRIDNNPNAVTCQIFPEQFYSNPATAPTTPTCPASQPGDRFKLTEIDGTGFVQPRPELENSAVGEYGQTSWRNRKVYAQSTTYNGSQPKDQTIQFDASELRRRCVGTGAEAGANGLDCNGTSSIFNNFRGLRYCWDDNGNSNVKIEVSSVSFAPNYTGFNTEKTIIDHGTFPDRTYVNFASGGGNCTDITIKDPSRRYIFRLKPIFAGSLFNDPSATDQFRFAVTYQAALIESPVVPSNQRLYIPDDTYLIDVVGQSGDIKRRLVAKKERKGRLLGIFDYVLYSGNENKDLCKAGVNASDVTYDTENCAVATTATAPTTNTLDYGIKKEASDTQQPGNPCNAPTGDGSAYGGNTLQLCSTGNTFVYNYTYSGPNNPSRFILDGKQDLDNGAPQSAQIRVILTSPSGSVNQVMSLTGTTYTQYSISASALALKDGEPISVSIQMITDSCTGCGQNPQPANSDLNAYIDFFGLYNTSTLP